MNKTAQAAEKLQEILDAYIASGDLQYLAAQRKRYKRLMKITRKDWGEL